jgi:hypothetical protein
VLGKGQDPWFLGANLSASVTQFSRGQLSYP